MKHSLQESIKTAPTCTGHSKHRKKSEMVKHLRHPHSLPISDPQHPSLPLHMCFTKLLLALLKTQPRDEVHKSSSNS